LNYPLKSVATFFCERDSRIMEGIHVRCPNCRALHAAYFKNPIGADKAVSPWATVTWQRVGDTLETLTLSPSFMAVGHYHSFVRDGELQVDSAFGCKPNGAA